MRPRRPRAAAALAFGVIAMVAAALGACHRGAPDVRAAATDPSARRAPAPPRAAPRPPAPVPGAAAPIAHPNADADERDLGLHVAPRSLAMPRVALGRSATFSIDGRRRGWVLQLAAGELLTTPAFARGRVYVGAGFTSNTVYALDAETGALAWTGATPDGGPTAAIVEDDAVLFNTESCTLFAFDARTGRLRWSRWLGDPLMSQPVAARGRVFSAYPDGERGGFAMAALSMRTGAVLWRRGISADVLTAPVIADGALYFTTMDGVVYRMDPATGRRAWARALGASSAPAVFGERLAVAQRAAGGRERQLVLEAESGRTVERGEPVRAPYAAQRADTGGTQAGWSYEGARPVHADGRLYYAMGDDLVARDAASGREVWRRHYPHAGALRGVTSPAVVGAELVVGTRDGNLFGLDIDTGATTWAYHVGEPVAFQPTVANGWVYAATARGKVVGLEVADRSLDGWHMWGGNAQHNGLTLAAASSDDAPAAPPGPAALPASDAARPTRGTLRALAAHAAAHASSATATPPPAEFPVVRTEMRAEVSGFVARVTVTQTFENPLAEAADAEYLFPLPADAAVDAMQMRVGERVVRAQIHERDAARAGFERARACGRRAALLEQERPNLFRQRVANIRPGEALRVELRFAAVVPYHDGVYELALPLAVGSRYTPGAGPGAPAPRPAERATVAVRLDAGLPLAAVESPSHPAAVRITREGDRRAAVELAPGEAPPDRDFVLRYRPAVHVVEPAVLVARAAEAPEGYFTLALHPDAQAPVTDVTPRDLVFVLDTSSSMRGAPLAHAQALLHRAVDQLRPDDTFRLVRFSDEAGELAAAPVRPTLASRRAAHAFIDALQAAGATEMRAGLAAALRDARRAAEPDRMRVVVLLTDGFIGNEREVLRDVSAQLGFARLFVFGVGTNVNRYLVEQLAEIGRGYAEVVAPSEDAAAAADRFYTRIDRPFLTDVTVDWGGLDVRDVYPRVVPDLFADRPLLVHGRYGRPGEGEVRITGSIRGRLFERVVHVSLPARAADHEALPSVWARARVHDLSHALLLGETPALREEVTALGLRFNLVTEYTSFLAVDEDGSAGCQGSVPAGGGGGGSIGFGSISAFGYGGGSGYGTAYGMSLASRSVAAPMVRVSAPTIHAVTSPTTIRATVLRNVPQVRACYDRALLAHRDARGRVVVRFVVAPDGSVASATVAEDSLGLPEVASCVADAAQRWTFAPPPDGVTVTVNYPFLFEPPPPPEPGSRHPVLIQPW